MEQVMEPVRDARLHYIVVDEASGRIVKFGKTNRPGLDLITGGRVIEADGRYPDGSHYWDLNTETLETRPPMLVAQDLETVSPGETVTLTSIPEGAELFIFRESQGVVPADGVAELVFDTEGYYRIKLFLFPYQDWEGETHVTQG